jgi:hypothetical protein
MFITFGLGLAMASLWKAVPDNRPAELRGGRSSSQQSILFAPQPASPLRLLVTAAPADYPAHLRERNIYLAAQNRSARAVRRYGISWGVGGPQNTADRMGICSEAINSGSLLGSGEVTSRPVPVMKRADGRAITVWVDFVEFADGGTWDPQLSSGLIGAPPASACPR